MLVLLGDAQVVAGAAPGSVLQGEVAGIARAGPGLDDLIVPQQLHGDGVGAQNAASMVTGASPMALTSLPMGAELIFRETRMRAPVVP